MTGEQRRGYLCVVLVGVFVLVLALSGCSGGGGTAPEGDAAGDAAQAVRVTVDNRSPNCKIISGDWRTVGREDGNGCYGPDFLYLLADRQHVGRVRFFPKPPLKALYRVAIYWSAASNRTTDQPVIVHDAKGRNTVYHVNLQQNGHRWYFLRHRHLMGPKGCYIEFNNNTDAGYCNADAVRLVRR